MSRHLSHDQLIIFLPFPLNRKYLKNINSTKRCVSDANVEILISKGCPSINARHLSRTDCPTNGVTGHKMAKCQGFINLNGFSIRRRPKWTGGSCLIKRNWISSGRHQGCAGQKKNKHHMKESEWGKYLSEKLGFPLNFNGLKSTLLCSAPQVLPIFTGRGRARKRLGLF